MHSGGQPVFLSRSFRSELNEGEKKKAIFYCSLGDLERNRGVEKGKQQNDNILIFDMFCMSPALSKEEQTLRISRPF